MGAYGVTVEMEATFRGQAERFTNVWHYSIAAPIEADYDLLANAVVARQRLVMPTNVTFKSVRVYGPTDGNPQQNLIRLIKDLTGAGTDGRTGGAFYPELCFTVSMPAGRSETTQRRIYVRKYIRVIVGRVGSDNPQTGQLTTATRDFLKGWYEGCKSIGPAFAYPLCTPRNQQVPQDSLATCLEYAHVRQMKQ